MRPRWICLGSLLAAIAGLGIASQPGSSGDLVVHEWGTFLAMSGSDGISLEGMYHEEHALPAFVHARGRDQLRLPSVVIKGETPVIYFYTDRAQKVRVDVGFPRGIWTQWYPQAQVVAPPLSGGGNPPDLKDGHITWCAEIVPATAKALADSPTPPEAAEDALWNHARDVDAAFVRTANRASQKTSPPVESERFLFYRGLGRAPLPVRMTAAEGGTLESSASDRHEVRHVFLLRVEGGRGTYAHLPSIVPGERLSGIIPSMGDARPLAEFTRLLADDLAARLVEEGLFPKEARAMVNTWKTSYFQAEGIRALFILPRAWTDEVIPMTVFPPPKEVVRVMVGRLELLAPERERAAERAVGDLSSADPDARGRAYTFLRDQGRYVEPIIRRVLKSTDDERVRTLCRRLLLTDFVTDLRAAVHSPTDGTRVHDDPVHVRAQLASLLREVGLESEAKAEGDAVVAALRGRPEPPMDRVEARSHLRALARAAEGQGDDRSASEWYGKFIRYGSQAAWNRNCIGCHRDAGPRELAWFRDWWVGPRYARSTLRAGLADTEIAAHEAALAKDSGDASSRIMLAYLLESRGETARARTFWADLAAQDLARADEEKLARSSAGVQSRNTPGLAVIPGPPGVGNGDHRDAVPGHGVAADPMTSRFTRQGHPIHLHPGDGPSPPGPTRRSSQRA